MHALGVPTTRALSLVSTTLPVSRERLETGAVVCRLAPCWIRFGTLELQFYRRQYRILIQLINYVIKYHFPELQVIARSLLTVSFLILAQNLPEESKYSRFFAEVVRRTAVMIAHWQAVGFEHGVMNTDNFHILGLTLDYGKFYIYLPLVMTASTDAVRLFFFFYPATLLPSL
jgi:uncharacterized protein YdiU (UPF0061 family)